MSASSASSEDELSPHVFKICRTEEWDRLSADGSWAGSGDDTRDGFIHLSTREQVAGTLVKHFAEESGLVLLTLERVRLGGELVFEPSRGGQLFPHLHGRLVLDSVVAHVILDGNEAPDDFI